MNKADKYFIETLKELKNTPYRDQEPRAKWEDGTPAHTQFITQKTFTYDISKGEFPINTLRPTAIKGAFQELKTIYIGQSNKQEDFLSNGVSWWADWMNEEGNLGTAYSWNLEKGLKKELTEVVPRVVDKKLGELDFSHYVEVDITRSLDGVIHPSNHGDYIIVETNLRKEGDSRMYKRCIFTETGYETVVRKDVDGAGKDLFKRSVKGVGFLGDLKIKKSFSPTTYEKLHSVWSGVIKRCYTPDRVDADAYYNRGIFVHNRWHSFSNFLEDIRHTPNYFLAERENFEKWEIDKDYFSSNCYSKDTVVFIPHYYNQRYKFNSTLRVHLDNNKAKDFLSLSEACEFMNSIKDENWIPTNLHSSLLNDRIYKNTNIYYHPTTNPNRYKNSKNQINEILESLGNDKFGRRHMLSFYNWAEQEHKQLVECAFMNLFSVRVVGGVNYIDQTLIQRSSDFILAGTINCIQYVMMNMIICNHLKYKTGQDWQPGKFMWVVQNLHVYDRHLWALDEILERCPINSQPEIRLKCEPKDFYTHTIDDFEITLPEGIEPLSKKLELAI